jgi:hypothetical protein
MEGSTTLLVHMISCGLLLMCAITSALSPGEPLLAMHQATAHMPENNTSSKSSLRGAEAGWTQRYKLPHTGSLGRNEEGEENGREPMKMSSVIFNSFLELRPTPKPTLKAAG